MTQDTDKHAFKFTIQTNLGQDNSAIAEKPRNALCKCNGVAEP